MDLCTATNFFIELDMRCKFSTRSVNCRTEADIFKALDLEYKEPWNRNTFDNAGVVIPEDQVHTTSRSEPVPREDVNKDNCSQSST